MATAHVSPQTPQATNEPPPRVHADDVNTDCLRAMTYLRQRTGPLVAERGEPRWDVKATWPSGRQLVGQVWLTAEPSTRWQIWCQVGTPHVRRRGQGSRPVV